MIVSRRWSKYGARKSLFGGKLYASTAERDYAVELAARQHAGEIRDLEEQPVVELVAGITYRPDFVFEEKDPRHMRAVIPGLLKPGYYTAVPQPIWRRIWVDVKGVETETFRLKARLWKQFGPGVLRIVKRKDRKHGFVVTREIVPG